MAVPPVLSSTWGVVYCDHQENRKSVIGRDHLRVPSGVPLPASGLSAVRAARVQGHPEAPSSSFYEQVLVASRVSYGWSAVTRATNRSSHGDQP